MPDFISERDRRRDRLAREFSRMQENPRNTCQCKDEIKIVEIKPVCPGIDTWGAAVPVQEYVLTLKDKHGVKYKLHVLATREGV